MKNINKNIIIIGNLDGYANSVRPVEIKNFLEKQGHKISILDTHHLGRSSALGSWKYLHYFIQTIITLENLLLSNLDKYFYFYFLIIDMKIRAFLVTKIIIKGNYDIVICENSLHTLITTKNIPCYIILDLPAPIAEELYYSNKLSLNLYNKLNNLFKVIYKNADKVTFHWNIYNNYIKQNNYNGENIFELNWGCKPQPFINRAKYNIRPKIIFLGYLAGQWVNLPLLSKLSKLYPIDVYGGPPPDKKWGLNYKGYAPSTGVLKDYQFGLISISKDKLRKSSFSSKHLEYLSFGLPVLTPDWRKDTALEDVSIFYNENNFLTVLKKYSEKKLWDEISERSFKKAKGWEWEKVLNPLCNIINNV